MIRHQQWYDSNTRKTENPWIILFALWIAVALPVLAYMLSAGMVILPGSTAYAQDTRVVEAAGSSRVMANVLPAQSAPAVERTADSALLMELDHTAITDADAEVRAAAAATAHKVRARLGASAGVSGSEWTVVSVAPQDPSWIVVAVRRDLIVSHDGGSTWQRLENVLPSLLDTLVISPADVNVMYAGVDGLGLYKSEDGGRSWKVLDHGLQVTPGARFGVTAIALDPTNPQRIVVSAGVWMGTGQVTFYPVGILASSDGGKSWTRVDQDQVVQPMDGLWLEGKTLYAAKGTGTRRYQLD